MNYIYILAIVILWIKTKPNFKLFNIKPFNCELCLTFWITLVYCHQTGEHYGIAPCLALLAPLTLSLYDKLWRILTK